MKKKYIKPNVSVSFVVVESQLLAGTVTGTGIGPIPGDNGFAGAKKHDFSSWDYDFDEEDESESNSSSKSLWEN